MLENCRIYQFFCHAYHVTCSAIHLSYKKIKLYKANKIMRNTTQIKQTAQQTQIAIIGAGFGGLAMAIRLLQNNIQDFVILEKANDIGGTWRENQYPGAACDVQSHMYSLSFAPKSDWSKRYAEAAEIFAYIQSLISTYDLKKY